MKSQLLFGIVATTVASGFAACSGNDDNNAKPNGGTNQIGDNGGMNSGGASTSTGGRGNGAASNASGTAGAGASSSGGTSSGGGVSLGGDRAYMDAQVTTHRELLALIDSSLLPSAQNPALDAMLADMRTHVAAHPASTLAILEALP